MHLIAQGLNNSEIARAVGVSRTTVRDWRRGNVAKHRVHQRDLCPRCGQHGHNPADLPHPSYAYLLGMYLGDGHISSSRIWRLRISLAMVWPGIVLECWKAMEAVFPSNRVSFCQPDPNSDCVVASVYSNQLPCLFPQHGPGPKHLRPIELADWQQEIVTEQPGRFLRGLIHSDGSRFTNRVRVKGKTYEYPRYNFTNASDDIRGLFSAACDQLGIAWRRMNERNISVARRDAVARLDEFVGPKN
jgi:hypothetical protein